MMNFCLITENLALAECTTLLSAINFHPSTIVPASVSELIGGFVSAVQSFFYAIFWNDNQTLCVSGLPFPADATLFPSFLPEVLLVLIITYLLLVTAAELEHGREPKVLAVECWKLVCLGLAFASSICTLELFGVHTPGPVLWGYFYVSSGLTAAKLLILLTSLFVLATSRNYIREHSRHVLEFSTVMLTGVLLLLLLVSANNLMVLFLSLAGFSLTLYTLIIYDVADTACREASVKYFYLSALSAGLIAYGTFLIYNQSQSVIYGDIQFFTREIAGVLELEVVSAATIFILTGLLFKLSAFPAQFWAVEVYEGSPGPVMSFFILPVKVAVFISLLRLVDTALIEMSSTWLPMLTVAALGSLLWGAFAAAHERKITRFLGYASINQIGYLLLGVVADTDDALRAAFYYLILYTVMTGGFLLIVASLRKEDNSKVVFISDFRGLNKSDNLVCWHLSIFLFAMAGIPPLGGFFGKYYLLAAVMEKHLFITAAVAVAISLVSTYYYLRIIKTFWFEEDIAVKKITVLLGAAERVVLSLLELFLWVAVVAAPLLLACLGDVSVTLTLCG